MDSSKAQKSYKRYRMQTFIAATLGYALYYVCRLSMGVMKQPLIDAGLLSATQLGVVGACLYWTYAVGKLVNGFLADGANIRRFMATGIIISIGMNFIMGILGVGAQNGQIANGVLFAGFCILWSLNGWAQSMGAPACIVALSRWMPLKVRGTFYGIFSASHNIGEGLSFIFVGSIVAAFGWKWGFFGAALGGVVGLVLVLLFFHDSPESKDLPPHRSPVRGDVAGGIRPGRREPALGRAGGKAAEAPGNPADAEACHQEYRCMDPGGGQRFHVHEPLCHQ